MKVYILNDTSGFSHPGCDLTMLAYKQQCERVGLEILGTVPKDRKLEPYYDEFEKADFLIINGEGSIHDNNRTELIFIAGRFPSVLINAVYQNNIARPAMLAFQYVAVRESASYHEIVPQLDIATRVDIVPDLVFSTMPFIGRYINKAIGNFGTTDSVINPGKGDIDIECKHYGQYIMRLCDFKSLLCGRFHAIVLASMLEIPFCAYGSNTHKNKALMHDMGVPELYADNLMEALKLYRIKRFPETIRRYTAGATHRIESMFNHLADLRL